jgi:hypothetical protein
MTLFNSEKCKHFEKTIFYMNQMFNCEILFILLPQDRLLYKSFFDIYAEPFSYIFFSDYGRN